LPAACSCLAMLATRSSTACANSSCCSAPMADHCSQPSSTCGDMCAHTEAQRHGKLVRLRQAQLRNCSFALWSSTRFAGALCQARALLALCAASCTVQHPAAASHPQITSDACDG
jgi:hypothetical protein